MARMRNIKPGFFLNDELAEVPPLGRLLYAGLWTIADREGRLKDHPKRIKIQTLPWDKCDVEQLLCELASRRFIVRYTVDGEGYIAIPAWHKHQTPNIKERPSILPGPPHDDASTVPIPCQHRASTALAPPDTETDTETVNSGTAREVDPVENSVPSPTPRSEGSKRKPRKPKTPTACDGGEPCPTLMVKGVRQGIAQIDPLHSGQLWQPETDLGGRMHELAAYICESAQDILPALEREQREKACQRMLKRSVDRMAAAHAKEPIRNLPAYIVGLLKRQCLGDVIGDDLVEDLRREASASYGKRDGEPVAIGAALAGRLAGRTA